MYELALSAADTPGPCPSGAIGSTCQNKATDTECRLAFADDPIVNDNRVSSNCMTMKFFAEMCRSRCLSCCLLPEYGCSDEPNVVPMSCADVKKQNLCNSTDPVLQDAIQRGCAQTCGLCSTSSCKDMNGQYCITNEAKCKCADKVNNCDPNYCEIPAYKYILEEQCKKTCGKC
ncbi:unnamed protein product [Dracunculus medinensis]|uniref:ShTK domain protein n=1 Tax=Dracunculus medinensis TaxID=318479 RepID=A0A0N4UQH5_DRAME|nr:unnamed protein product [Dracunculus medinensis]